MGKNYDVSDFDHSIVVGARHLLLFWDFHMQQSLEITQNEVKNTNISSEMF